MASINDFFQPYIDKGVFFETFCVEDDGYIILAVTSCNAFAVDALDEHPLALALHHLKIFDFVLQRDLSHHLAAFRLDAFGDLVGHGGGFGARPY